MEIGMDQLLMRMAKLLAPQIIKLQKGSYMIRGSLQEIAEIRQSREDYLNELIDVHTECLLKMNIVVRKEYLKWLDELEKR
jgi:hypothetical protein